jgi:hypothetical protein
VAVELVAAAERLSQGDFLVGAPSVWLESLNPMIQVDRNRYELREGFVGSHRPGTKHKANASEVRVVGAVLSHDCELDKVTTTATVLVALVRRLEGLTAEVMASIRENRQLRALYVPPSSLLTDDLLTGTERRPSSDPPASSESFIDFRRVTTILRPAADQLTVAASMNEAGRTLLQTHLFRFFTRRVLPPEWTEWEVEDEA